MLEWLLMCTTVSSRARFRRPGFLPLPKSMESQHENLWGYLKRLQFVQHVIAESFSYRSADSLRVLDVGCGNGSELALPLARLGFQVTGIDIHAPSIEHARLLGVDVSNLSYVCGPVEELKSPPYDVVILSEVLEDRKSTRLNSSHSQISYAVFCLKKKKKKKNKNIKNKIKK